MDFPAPMIHAYDTDGFFVGSFNESEEIGYVLDGEGRHADFTDYDSWVAAARAQDANV